MRGKGFVLGSTLGILSALILVLLASFSGAATHHIDLIPAVSQNVPSSSSVVVGTSTTLAQPGSQAATQVAPSVPTPTSLGVSLIRDLIPLVAAVVLGAASYGFFSRRLNAD
jgi:hypothetical protein